MSDSAGLLKETADRLFNEQVGDRLRIQVEAGEFPEKLWSTLNELALPRLLTQGGDAEDAFQVLRSAGVHAAPVPLLETMLASTLLASCGIDDPGGVLTVAPVHPGDTLVAKRDGKGLRLSGTASLVPWAEHAHAIVALASAPDGDLIVRIEKDRLDIQATAGRSGDPVATIRIESLSIGENAVAPAEREKVLARGALLRSAQMAGALEAILDMTVRYAGEREQFGRPLAKFQAIQQQLAVLASEVAAATVAARDAIGGFDEPDAGLAVAAAKLRVSEAASRAAAIAHQVHGAIGFTEEYALNHRTRRLWAWREQFGNERYWAERIGAAIIRDGADALWPTLCSD